LQCSSAYLHIAASKGYKDIVKILLDAGANKDLKTNGKNAA
jgi:ankyrin repeat protein